MDDCNLEKLLIKPGKLSPEFKRDVTEYKVTLASEVEKLNVDPRTSDTGASYSISGGGGEKQVPLKEGEVTEIKIEVTAEDGTTKNYFIHARRLSARDATLSSLKISPGTLQPTFSPDVIEYTCLLACNITSLTVTPAAPDAKNKITVNGEKPGIATLLNVGETKIEVEVVSVDESNKQVYTLIITKKHLPRYVKITDPQQAMKFECPISLNPQYCPVTVKGSDPKHTFSGPVITEYTKMSKYDPISGMPLDPEWRVVDYPVDTKLSALSACIPLTYGATSETVKFGDLGSHVEKWNITPKTEDLTDRFKGTTAPVKHSVEVRKWEKQLQQIFDETDANELAKNGQKEVEHYLKSLPKPGQSKHYDEGESPMDYLNQAIYNFATAIKFKPKDPVNHFQLGLVLEEKYYAEDMFGLKKEESSDIPSFNVQAKESSKEEEVLAIAKLRGVDSTSPISLILKAVDEEYHHLVDSGQSGKADHVMALYAWYSKKASQEGAAALKAENDANPLGQAFMKYMDALVLDEVKAVYNFHVGRLLVVQGNYADAVKRLEVTLTWNAKHQLAKIYLGLALALQKGGPGPRTKETIGYLQEGMEVLLTENSKFALSEDKNIEITSLQAENLIRLTNVYLLRVVNQLGLLLATNPDVKDSISAQDVFYNAALLACQVLPMLPRGDAYQQVEWVLLDAHAHLLDLLSRSGQESLIAARCERLSALIIHSTIPQNSQLLNLQERCRKNGFIKESEMPLVTHMWTKHSKGDYFPLGNVEIIGANYYTGRKKKRKLSRSHLAIDADEGRKILLSQVVNNKHQHSPEQTSIGQNQQPEESTVDDKVSEKHMLASQTEPQEMMSNETTQVLTDAQPETSSTVDDQGSEEQVLASQTEPRQMVSNETTHVLPDNQPETSSIVDDQGSEEQVLASQTEPQQMVSNETTQVLPDNQPETSSTVDDQGSEEQVLASQTEPRQMVSNEMTHVLPDNQPETSSTVDDQGSEEQVLASQTEPRQMVSNETTHVLPDNQPETSSTVDDQGSEEQVLASQTEPQQMVSNETTQVLPDNQPETSSTVVSDTEDSMEDSSSSEYIPVCLEQIEDSFDSESSEDIPPIKKHKGEGCLSRESGDEYDILSDIRWPKIYISRVVRSSTTKCGQPKKSDRVYNKKSFCPYCQKYISNFSQHLYRQHREEDEMRQIIYSKGNEPKVRTLFSILRHKSAHENNLRTLKENEGEIILGRRLTKETTKFDVSLYGPCPHCLEWMQKKSLHRHQKFCPLSRGHAFSLTSLKTQSDVLTERITSEASQLLIKEVFSTLRNDSVGVAARSDKLIISIGNQWIERLIGNTIKRGSYTSGIMRLIAKFLIILRQDAVYRQDGQDENTLSDYLRPQHFDKVVSAAFACSQQDADDITELKTPSNAIKLGYEIKRLVSTKLAIAIRERNTERREECADFMQLMNSEWNVKVTKLARLTLNERRFNKNKSLPEPSDLQKLNDYLRRELADLEMCLNETYDIYRRCCILCEAKLIAYNRRRSGEVEALKLSAYSRRTIGTTALDMELTRDLTTFEKKLVESQEVVEVRGKTGRGVPILLPKETKEVLAFITNLETRAAVGVRDENPYVFASRGIGVFRGYACLRIVADEANLQCPQQITSTNLRKYMATITQVLDMNRHQLEWVCDHLGHTMDVHRTHYRARSDMIERLEVAKVLLLQDSGKIKNFVGKQLHEIQFKDIVHDLDETEYVEQDTVFTATPPGDVNEIDLPEVFDTIGDEEEDNDDSSLSAREGKIHKKRRKTSGVKRQKWTVEEEKEIRLLFKKWFENGTCPGQRDCMKAQALSKKMKGTLYLRPKDNIKKKVWNMLQQYTAPKVS